MTQNKVKVLYIDDEENNLYSFKAVFRFKYEVHTCLSAQAARTILEQNPDLHVLITDQRMPGMTGVEFLESILTVYPLPIRVLLTGYADIRAVIDAVNKGKIFQYLSKPWDVEELTNTIEEAYKKYMDRANEQEYSETLEISNNQLEFLLRQQLLS